MFSLRAVARVASKTLVRASVQAKLPAAARAAPVAAASAVRSFRAVPARRNEEMFADDASNYTYQQAAVTAPAPAWSCTALVNGEFKTVSSSDYKGKWYVLFFYPLDFTFVCPTEIRAFSDRIAEFEKLGVSVIAASVDSQYSHLAWTKQPRKEGGLGPMKIPILADITKSISRNYGVLLEEEGIALRGLFIVDPKGVLRQSTINDLPIGRSVDETLRLLQAFQYHEKHGDVCPAGWTPGQEAMKTDEAGLKKYFEKKQ